MSSQHFDVVIVGGGVIGLSSAFELARTGAKVVLVDPSPGRGSSFAAAGMLAPGAESIPEHADLAADSALALRRWPAFAQSLSDHVERRFEVHQVGSLFVGWNISDQRDLQRYLGEAAHQGIVSTEVTREARPLLFEELHSRVTSGHFVVDDSFIDPDECVATLIGACQRLGVELISERVVDTRTLNQSVEAHTSSAVIQADRGIVATGVDSLPLDILAGAHHKLRSIRGVTLRLGIPEGDTGPMIRGTVEGRVIYVIRRADGTAVVGATSDESAETIVEAADVRRLLEDLSWIAPGLDGSTFLGARAGRRPASSDHLPFFEVLDGGRWAWSSGHFRHGFLLAPLAATSAVDFVNEQRP